MRLLSINIYGDGYEAFKEANKDLFELEKKDQRFMIRRPECVYSRRYDEYKELLESSDSQYVLYADCSMIITADSIRKAVDYLEKNACGMLCLKMEGDLYNSRRIQNVIYGKRLMDPFFFNRYIFSRAHLIGITVDDESAEYFEDIVLLKMCAKTETVFTDATIACIEEDRLESMHAKYFRAFEKSWYTEYINNIVVPMLTDGVTYEQQCLILYLICLKYYVNRTIYNKRLLDAQEIEEFNKTVDKALKLIEPRVFFDRKLWGRLNGGYCMHLYYRRCEGVIDIRTEGSGADVQIFVNGNLYPKNHLNCRVYVINIIDEKLLIDVSLLNNFFELSQDGGVFAVSGNRQYALKKTNIYSEISSLGCKIIDRPTYQAEIPLEGVDAADIRLVGKVGSAEIVLPLMFMKAAARLEEKSRNSYCRLEGFLLSYADNAIHIQRGYSGWLRKEIGSYRDIARLQHGKKDALKTMGLRFGSHVYGKISSNKPKWIFFDKLYKGGDNGEHLFDYAFHNVDYADSYYIIRSDIEDYKRLKAKYGRHILPYNSIRQKVAVLNADLIFATHANAFKFCGFGTDLQECLRGDLKAKIVCIQHGLTIQDMPQHQSRLIDNTRAYFCASEKEIENLEQESYGYNNNELILTGLPRYDGLKDREKKQILLTPTWRREIVISGNKTGDSKEYNPRFKETEYFRIYNELINNEKLNACASECGYKIVFLLHPTIGMQIEDFDPPETVEMVNGTVALYEDYLAESSLMITDYSGVQFDFAYMKKPVLYYQPEELPPQYENGHFSYEKDGFGPVIEKQKDLIDAVCAYMKNGCRMEPEYIARVEQFFKYTDDRNCERICAAIKERFYS